LEDFGEGDEANGDDSYNNNNNNEQEEEQDGDHSYYEDCYGYNNDDFYGGRDCEDYDYDYGELGGGFQYIRDEFPIEFNSTVECPKCGQAKTSPMELSGPVDQSFVDISIEGATPDDVEIKILAVGQDKNPRCNAAVFNTTAPAVRPNARGIGNSTVMVRRTLPLGSLSPMRYTIFFSASNHAGSCSGQVEVCSPPEGLSCTDYYYYGFDATATRYCDSSY